MIAKPHSEYLTDVSPRLLVYSGGHRGFGSRGYDLLEILWWRYTVYVLLLAALFGRRILVVASTRPPLMQIVRSLTMAVMPTSFALSHGHGASAELVWSVFWIAPLLVILPEVVLLNARPVPVAWVASAFGAVATAALFGHGALPQRASTTPALVVAPSFAVYLPITRAFRSDHIVANLFVKATALFATFTPMMPWPWSWPTPGDAAGMIAIGAIGLVALWSLDRACFIEPLGAVVSAAAIVTVWRAADAFGASCAVAHINRN